MKAQHWTALLAALLLLACGTITPASEIANLQTQIAMGVGATMGSSGTLPPPTLGVPATMDAPPGGNEQPPEPASGATQISPADGMTQIYVPAGTFLMGRETDDPGPYANEIPQHEVYLDGFWIDRTEVTNTMYWRCISQGGCAPPADFSSPTRSDYFESQDYANFPVMYVDWYDAATYCSWAGRRLPTEAEWEKAARGTEGVTYPWGNDPPSCSLANYHGCAEDTVEVGSYPAAASHYGALDMAGNVHEWVADWYGEDYYSSSPSANPQGPASGIHRVGRGGSASYGPAHLSTTDRSGYFPTRARIYLGFRCAMDVSP